MAVLATATDAVVAAAGRHAQREPSSRSPARGTAPADAAARCPDDGQELRGRRRDRTPAAAGLPERQRSPRRCSRRRDGRDRAARRPGPCRPRLVAAAPPRLALLPTAAGWPLRGGARSLRTLALCRRPPSLLGRGGRARSRAALPGGRGRLVVRPLAVCASLGRRRAAGVRAVAARLPRRRPAPARDAVRAATRSTEPPLAGPCSSTPPAASAPGSPASCTTWSRTTSR